MTRKEIQTYQRAAKLAVHVMGRRKPWGDAPVWVAEEDPLAWWCMTELLVRISKSPKP